MKLNTAERVILGITLAAVAFFAGFYLHGAVMTEDLVVQTETRTVQEATASPAASPAAAAAEPSAHADPPQAGEAGEPIDLNTATQAELETLPGIGEVMARRILEYRDAQGGFRTAEELMNVSGIGEKTFEKLRDYIKVG